MQVEWLGTASLLMQEADTCIAFDPYLRHGSSELPSLSAEMFCQADAVFITHPHLDHFADMNQLMAVSSAPVYVCEKGITIARRERWDCTHFQPIAPGDEIACKDMHVHALQAQHCKFDIPLVIKTIARGIKPRHFFQAFELAQLNHRFAINPMRDVLAFEICSRTAHCLVLGSAALAAEVVYPKDLDAVFWAYQGRSDIASYSISLLRKLDTKRVILTHFDDAFPPVSQAMDTSAFIAAAHKELPGIEVICPRLGEVISLS